MVHKTILNNEISLASWTAFGFGR